MYMANGYLPEGVDNYLALLGWSLSEDEDRFSLAQMAEAFDISRVNPNPARFDLKKCTALNGDWIRSISAEDLTRRLIPFLADAGLVAAEPTEAQRDLLRRAVPLVHERIETLTQAIPMLDFLFVDDARFAIDPADAAKLVTTDTEPVLRAAREALAGLPEWETDPIEDALRAALVDGLGLKPKLAFGPVRVALTGRRISPPLFESAQLLGRDRTVSRLDAALASLVG